MSIPADVSRRIVALGLPSTTLNDVIRIVEDVIESMTPQRGGALPTSWQPNDYHFQYGMERGLSPEDVLRCAIEMKEWAAANRNRQVAKKSDWGLAFMGWLRRDAEKRKKGTFTRAGMLDLAMEFEERAANGHQRNGAHASAEPLLFDASHYNRP